jgi:uncharacterized protein involved in exopolysaccharide biosynthesis
MALRDPHPAPRFAPAPASIPVVQLPLLEALRKSIIVVLLPVVLLAGAGVALGLVRKPTYTSEARLNVGGLDLTEQSIQGYTNAVQFLAVAYARAIDADNVVLPVARRLKLPKTQIAKQVIATPIQNSPVVVVDATSKNPLQAQRLADFMADSLVRYAVTLNAGAQASQKLLANYIGASKALQRATQHLQATPPNSPQHQAAQTQADLARLKLQTTGFLYQQSQAGQATINLVQKLAPATQPSSDRMSVLQQYVAGGVLGGLLLGIALAVLRINRLSKQLQER